MALSTSEIQDLLAKAAHAKQVFEEAIEKIENEGFLVDEPKDGEPLVIRRNVEQVFSSTKYMKVGPAEPCIPFCVKITKP